MKDDQSTEILGNDQTSAAPPVSTDTENVTVNKLMSDFTDTFSVALSNTILQFAEEYNGKMNMISYFNYSTHYSLIQNVDQRWQ